MSPKKSNNTVIVRFRIHLFLSTNGVSVSPVAVILLVWSQILHIYDHLKVKDWIMIID